MKKLLIVLMSMIMVMAMASCGEHQKDTPVADIAFVTIEIDFPDESGVADVEDVEIEVPGGSSVLDVLMAYSEQFNCEVLMSDTSKTAYVTSIGGVAATDVAGWVYEVNDEMVMEAADKCVLNDGDEVSWDFETWGE